MNKLLPNKLIFVKSKSQLFTNFKYHF